MNQPVVFLGPSLALDVARTVLDADYQPPCRMGDVLAAVQRRPSMIVIIDGLFEQTPAVWHKEILFALAQGIPVIGGGSMGALRAAELHAFGMTGVGRIFHDYASGVLEDDDEVAVGHGLAEAGFTCQTDAMVNLRHGLALAVQAGALAAELAARLATLVKALHYSERSWQRIYELGEQDGAAAAMPALRNFIAGTSPNLKRDDALDVLRTAAQGVAAAPAAFRFEPTKYWEQLRTYHQPAGAGGDGGPHAEQLLNHVRIASPQRKSLRERALLMHLASAEMDRLGLPRGDRRGALLRWRRERGLTTPQAMADWLREQHAGQEECLRMAQLDADLRTLTQHYAMEVDSGVALLLKQDGDYADTLAQLRRKQAWLDQAGMARVASDDVDDMAPVLAWYELRHGKLAAQLPEHARELGFASFDRFLPELLAEYMASTQ